MRVAVIGAGIVGSSVAFRLAQEESAEVTLIDRDRPASGTTSTSFAWLNANQKTPRSYHELNRAGMQEHFGLQEELGRAPWLHQTGNLIWTNDERDLGELRSRVERLSAWDYTAGWLDASEVNRTLEPNVVFPRPDIPVAYFPEEAWVDAPQLTNTLTQLAVECGARTYFGTSVESVEIEGGRVASLRFKDGEEVRLDAVVNAAGPGADRVASMFGVRLPLASTGGLLVRLAVEDGPIGRILHAPEVNARPDGAGYVLIHHDSIDRRLRSGEDKEALRDELVGRAREVLGASRAEASEIMVGRRPIPEDGYSCVGAVAELTGYYEAVTHSGVTLGPLLGRLLAREILTGEVDELVTPFRADRFCRS